jgi:hypothetical protein
MLRLLHGLPIQPIDLHRGDYTSPIQVHIGTGGFFPCHDGHDGNWASRCAQEEVPNKEGVKASRHFI